MAAPDLANMVMSSRHNFASKKVFFIREVGIASGGAAMAAAGGGADPHADPQQVQLARMKLFQDIGLVSADIELCFSSPLRRSVDTAIPLFLGETPIPAPIMLLPQLSSRVQTIADIGHSSAELKKEYEAHNLDVSQLESKETSPLSSSSWFFVDNSSNSSSSIASAQDARDAFAAHPWVESEEAFKERMDAFWMWLDKRKEKTVAVVTHADVIDQLTGQELGEGGVRVINWKGFRVQRRGRGTRPAMMEE